MNYFDDEDSIIEFFQDVETSSVLLEGESENAEIIFNMIHDPAKWSNWINSSKKSDPPPDFYSDRYQMMMEVMRVDDHAYVENGKLINQTNKRESKIQTELKASGIMDLFPNANRVLVNPDTDLPTDKDHNYGFYKENFIRTVRKHKSKIASYKANHPDFKLIFFILDESSAYFQLADDNNGKQNDKNGVPFYKGSCHFHFWDKSFVEELMVEDIDYVIWFAPYKLCRTIDAQMKLPEVCFFDTHSQVSNIIQYDDDLMKSSEN